MYKKMIFTTNKKFAKTTEPPIRYVASPVMTFSHNYRNHIIQKQNTPQVLDLPTPTVPKKKPMKWGEPTWFLLHTLAEKIKPEYYADIQPELLNLIYTICCNLPCPDCSKHANQYLNGINFKAITTKESLRIMLHQFHNEVNRRKSFQEFPLEEVAPKYSAANTVNIIHHFMQNFEDKSSNQRMIADNLYRSRIVLQLKAWFNKNIGYFDL